MMIDQWAGARGPRPVRPPVTVPEQVRRDLLTHLRADPEDRGALPLLMWRIRHQYRPSRHAAPFTFRKAVQ